MGALSLDELDRLTPFYINTKYKGMNGRLYATKEDCVFTEHSKIIHQIPFKFIKNISMPRIPKGNEEHGTIELADDKTTYSYAIDDDLTSAEEVYFYLKGKLLGKKQIDNFLKETVDLKDIECKKMFPPSIIARFITLPNLLYPGERIQAALQGRYCPSFSKHTYGVLTVTDKRIFFFDYAGMVARDLERSEFKSLRIINSFNNFSDGHGRKTYSVEFNDSDFIVSVRTSRHIKIEMFYKVLEPNKKLDESF